MRLSIQQRNKVGPAHVCRALFVPFVNNFCIYVAGN